MEEQEEREEPIENEYLISLVFIFTSPWGDCSAEQRVTLSAASPDKAVEKLVDSGTSFMDLAGKKDVITIWDEEPDGWSGNSLDHAQLGLDHVALVGISCEGEWVEVESQYDINAALNKAFAPSEATAKLAEFRAAYERGEKVNTADYLAAVPASQRAYLEQEIDRFMIEESPLRPYDAADFAKFQESELGQKAAELFDQAAQKHLGSDQP